MVTIKDIAAATGVSATTVSNVINGKTSRVSRQTIDKINKAIADLGYVPKMSARSLVSRSSKVIGFVNHLTVNKNATFMDDPFLSGFTGKLEKVLRENGYYLMLRTVETSEEFYAFLRMWDLDGLFFTGIFQDDFFETIRSQNIPTVLIDSYVRHRNICNVGLDDFGGSLSATDYLIGKGHRKIAFASPHIKDGGVLMERLSGYKSALGKASVPFDPSLVFECEMDAEHTMFVAKALAERPDVTALVTTSDFLAANIMANLHARGLRVPEDISIVGFDDLNICEITYPTLTTVHQDMDLKGRMAVKFMLDLLSGRTPSPCNISLPTRIVERKSVRDLK